MQYRGIPFNDMVPNSNSPTEVPLIFLLRYGAPLLTRVCITETIDFKKTPIPQKNSSNALFRPTKCPKPIHSRFTMI